MHPSSILLKKNHLPSLASSLILVLGPNIVLFYDMA